jgi:hypothetical protein
VETNPVPYTPISKLAPPAVALFGDTCAIEGVAWVVTVGGCAHIALADALKHPVDSLVGGALPQPTNTTQARPATDRPADIFLIVVAFICSPLGDETRGGDHFPQYSAASLTMNKISSCKLLKRNA